jgi:UDP-N-acetylbacillosamine N-acetyltransferase
MTSSPTRVFVYGAGGHGKVVYDALIGSGVVPQAEFFDDHLTPGTVVLDSIVRGGFPEPLESAECQRAGIALGVGDNQVRARIARRCAEAGFILLRVIHPRAVVSPFAQVAEGAVVLAGAIVNPSAHVGRGAIINSGAVVEHDVQIGDFSHVSPNATLGGGVIIGANAWIGLGAKILPGLEVGEGAVIGAGAVVTKSIPPHVTAFGVPACIRPPLGDRGPCA